MTTAVEKPAGDSIAARLRGFGPVGLLAIVLILLGGNLSGIPAGAILALLWAHWTRTPWVDLGFRAPRRWWLTVPLAILFGAALKVLFKSVVMPLLGGPPTNPVYHYLAGNTAALPGTIWTMIVAAGFGEEVVFRGFVFERMRARFGDGRATTIAAVVVSAALFGAAHFPDQRVAGAEMAFLDGLVFGAIFARTRSLPFLMIAHATFDLVAVAMIYWNVEKQFAHFFFK